jgi:hypothetical protein
VEFVFFFRVRGEMPREGLKKNEVYFHFNVVGNGFHHFQVRENICQHVLQDLLIDFYKRNEKKKKKKKRRRRRRKVRKEREVNKEREDAKRRRRKRLRPAR